MEWLVVAEKPVLRVVVGQPDEAGLGDVAAPGTDTSAWATILAIKALIVGGATATATLRPRPGSYASHTEIA